MKRNIEVHQFLFVHQGMFKGLKEGYAKLQRVGWYYITIPIGNCSLFCLNPPQYIGKSLQKGSRSNILGWIVSFWVNTVGKKHVLCLELGAVEIMLINFWCVNGDFNE